MGKWSQRGYHAQIMIRAVRRIVLGQPLPTTAATRERLTRPRAIGAFGLDALSSVAYGPDEILYVLILAGTVGMHFDLPIAVSIAVLLAIVAFSYRQTIYAYPHGGGSYTVAHENLGVEPGLIAAAALIVDYLTTIAVSVTAGVQAIIAFVPVLDTHRVIISVILIVGIIFINLRGVRESGAVFILPTYVFIGSLAALLVVGLARFIIEGAPPPLHTPPPAIEGVSLFLLLRAFAGGCTAMTGVEAIANGVPVFQRPQSKNAASTLLILALILGALFLGVAGLGLVVGALPSDQENIIAQVGWTFAGGTPLYYIVQVSAAIVLLLAANTSFNGFPRLAAIMAADDWLPHQFSHRGIRLAYSNGIIAIGGLAIVLVVAFGGSTHALIPLFAVGVFLCFTLSQAGMVRHWLRERGSKWHAKLLVNGIGALTTAVVTIVVMATKFAAGAWIVLLLIPLLVVIFHAIHHHYTTARRELSINSLPPLRHHQQRILVPVAYMGLAVARALEYACSISSEVTAIHFAADEEAGRDFERSWREWAPTVPLKVLPTPYREVIAPLVDLVKRCRADHPNEPVTIVLPEVVPAHWWEEPLHNQLELAISLALRGRSGVVVTSVPVRL